jgi:hypothetical protein
MAAVLIDPLMFQAGYLTTETEPCCNAGRLDMAVSKLSRSVVGFEVGTLLAA